MSIKSNITASYASQILVTLIGIAGVPLYVRYMGLEAYGLVGLFLTLQSWFQLLDLGLSPTMMRETARFSAGTMTQESYRGLLRAMEFIFLGVAATLVILMSVSASWIAHDWLRLQALAPSEARLAILLMAPSLGLRFVSALYRSVVTGFERIVWLSGVNLAIAVARFLLVVPYLIFVSASPVSFFLFQLVVSLFELAILTIRSYQLATSDGRSVRSKSSWSGLRAVVRFSAGIAFTGSVWVVITQIDKLILSKLLPLREYAVFTLAVLAASGVLVMSNPAGSVLVPRLTRLNAEGDDEGLVIVYRRATQVVALLAFTAAIVLTVFGREVLWAWTGRLDVVDQAAPVLALYAFGNGLLAVTAFPLYIQFARGDIKLHIIGQAGLLVLLVPAIIVGVAKFGMFGAGCVWLALNTLYLFAYVPLIHRRLLPGLHLSWILRDVAATAAPGAAVALLCAAIIPWPHQRMAVAAIVVLIGGAMVVVSILCSRWMREMARSLAAPWLRMAWW